LLMVGRCWFSVVSCIDDQFMLLLVVRSWLY